VFLGKTGVLALTLVGGTANAAEPPTDGLETAASTDVPETAAPPTLAHRTEVALSASAMMGGAATTRGAVGARVGRHVSDPFSLEAWGLLSPGTTSGWRPPLTTQLLPEQPFDLVTVRSAAAGTVHFTPLRGSLVAGRRTLAIGAYGLVGFGAAHTLENEAALQCDSGDPCAETLSQVHPTTNLGGGIRVASSRMIGRVELRRMAWIENLGGTGLEARREVIAELSVGGHWGSRQRSDESWEPDDL
jgi:hypothetical protein